MNGALVRIRREKDIVDAFERAGATTFANARPLGALGLEESRHLERLQAAQVVRPGEPGTWYLDEAGWSVRGSNRHRIIFMLLVASLFAMAVGLGLLPIARGP